MDIYEVVYYICICVLCSIPVVVVGVSFKCYIDDLKSHIASLNETIAALRADRVVLKADGDDLYEGMVDAQEKYIELLKALSKVEYR